MARRTPFEELERLLDEMQGRFESATSQRPLATSSRGSTISVDLDERDDEYVVTLDLPGFSREDVDVRLAGRTLTVEAERQSSSTEEGDDGQYVQRARRRATTRERVTFPVAVLADEVTATLRNGVLTVTVPKTESDQVDTGVDVE